MTRGILIGEIIDNLSNLNNQINFRCSLGLTDLNKVSEDFFCKLLNLIYGYELRNLNSQRSNEPGIDLGDESISIAFQITSQSDSAKINSTLQRITDEQKLKFKLIKILIIGQKQGSYSAINPDLINKFQFTKTGKNDPEDFISFNIIDTKDLLRDIISLDIKEINEIYNFVNEEIQKITIELEIPKSDGSYPTTLLNRIEITPETKARNAKVILDNSEFSNLSLVDINNYFDQLSSITRVTREIYYFIIYKGTFESDTICIYIDEAVRMLNISEKRLNQELTILTRKRLIFDIDEENPQIRLLLKNDDLVYMLLEIKDKMDLYKIIVSLDFTKLDN